MSLPPQPVRVDGDPARLAQVLTNLLNNAAKYTEEGGDIWLTVAPRGRTRPSSAVRDTGIGIPPEMLAAVFDLFTQVDRVARPLAGRAGIGLTLVRRLVEMHGGRGRGPQRRAGHGQRVRRPPAGRRRRSAAAVDRPGRRAARRPGRPPLRVLVVDDNVGRGREPGRPARLAGTRSGVAHDGPAGTRRRRRRSGPTSSLLDIGLPGMDGYEVARRLRPTAEPRQAAPGRRDRLRPGRGPPPRPGEAGFDHHFVKPVELAALRAALAVAR